MKDTRGPPLHDDSRPHARQQHSAPALPGECSSAPSSLGCSGRSPRGAGRPRAQDRARLGHNPFFDLSDPPNLASLCRGADQGRGTWGTGASPELLLVDNDRTFNALWVLGVEGAPSPARRRHGLRRTVRHHPDRVRRPRRWTGAPRPRARHGRGRAVVSSDSLMHRPVGDREVTEEAGGPPGRRTPQSSCRPSRPPAPQSLPANACRIARPEAPSRRRRSAARAEACRGVPRRCSVSRWTDN